MRRRARFFTNPQWHYAWRSCEHERRKLERLRRKLVTRNYPPERVAILWDLYREKLAAFRARWPEGT